MAVASKAKPGVVQAVTPTPVFGAPPQAAPPSVFAPTTNPLAPAAQPAPPVPASPPKYVPTLEDGPPQPALQAVGFNGGIQGFNKRVATVVDAHKATRGVDPSPGLTLDLARSQVDTPQLPSLLQGPSTKAAAKAAATVAAAGGHPPDVYTADDLINGLTQSVQAGGEARMRFFHQNISYIRELMHDPKYGPKIVAIIKPNPGVIATVVGRTLGQPINGLVHAPGAIVQAADAVAQDTWDATVNDDYSFKRSRAIAVATGQAYKRDFTHPYENSGNLVLDVFGFSSLGASGVARLGAAGRAFTEDGVAAAARAAVKHPGGGTVEIGAPGATEHALISDNPLVAAAQRVVLQHRQANLEKILNGDKIPAGLQTTLRAQGVRDWFEQYFSLPTKVGREADARRRVEQIQSMTVARELDHVAGAAPILARTYRLMPAKVRNGLTRGEDKAIQVISFGVTPADQIAWHEGQITEMQAAIDAGANPRVPGQIIRNHQRQITDLHLAEKVLRGNASPRFKTALDLTQQVVGEMEALKIDRLGMSPVTVRGRVGKPAGVMGHADYVADDQTLFPVAAPQTYPATGEVEPFYSKLEPRGKGKQPPSARQGFFAPKSGPFGVGPPRPLPELTHEFTGAAIKAGDYRIDVAHLTSEGYARTVRAVTVLNEHDRLWQAATDEPRTRFDTPIRDKAAIPDRLRELFQSLADNSISAQEAESLPADVQEMLKLLYPDRAKHLADPIEGVKWVDQRSMGAANEIPNRPGAFVKAMEAVNEPFRDAILFLRPAYALNLLGNAAILLFEHPLAAVPNVAKALQARFGHVWDEQTYRAVLEHVGQGRSASYATRITPKLGKKLSQAWGAITDQDMRVASFIINAKALGYGMDDIPALVKDGGKDLIEVQRRANKDMVQMDNMTEFEANTLRHIIFVYPWMSRSAVWSLRAVMEHPARVDVLSHLGQVEADSDPIFKNAPYWLKHTGYFSLGWNSDGTPRVFNPTSVNTFSTLSDIENLVSAGVGSNPGASRYNALSNLFGPAAELGLRGVTGTDQYGNKYPDRQWVRAASDVFQTLPQIVAFARDQKAAANPPLKPFTITSRASLEARLNSGLKRMVFTPGWLNGLGTLFAGGFSPRGLDLNASAARYWRDATPEQRHALQLTLLQKALGLQADFLKTKVPAGVRRAVVTAADLTVIHDQFQKAHGRGMTAREQTDAAIEYLAGKGAISPAVEARLKEKIPGNNNFGEIDTYRKTVVLGKAGGYNAMHQWDSDVHLLYSFRKEVFNQKFPDVAVSQPQLYAYGRDYLNYTRAAAALGKRVTDGKANPAELRVFQDEHSKPVLTRAPLYTVGKPAGLVKPGNIDVANRPVAHNKDGTISTVRSISVTDDQGHAYLLPTVINGKVVSETTAVAYWKKTGQNLGYFATEKDANTYGQRLHQEQAHLYAKGAPSLPSFAAMDWANTPPADREKQLATAAAGSWSNLSGFEKNLLGVHTPPDVSAGWAAYDHAVAEYQKSPTAPGLARQQKDQLAVDVGRDHPGFLKDYRFAQKPLAERFSATSEYKQMPAGVKSLFDQHVLTPARKTVALIAQARENIKNGAQYDVSPTTYYERSWKHYVAGQVQPWLTDHPELRKEINLFPKSFLDSLVTGG